MHVYMQSYIFVVIKRREFSRVYTCDTLGDHANIIFVVVESDLPSENYAKKNYASRRFLLDPDIEPDAS